jgi:protein TonB
MRRWMLVSLALHLAAIGSTLWWLVSRGNDEPPLTIHVDLGTQDVPARKTSAAHSAVKAPVPELPPADEVSEPSPDKPGEDTGTSGDAGGPVIDALTPGQSLEKPALIGYPLPDYPREARHKGWEGVVEALATVDANGQLLNLQLSHSSGHPELDAAALTALRGARYKPGTVDGTPATATLTVTVRFRLQ